jgi:hypothetical protein
MVTERVLPKMEARVLEVLEKLVDAHGLHGVLEALREVCYNKANHIASNWQDTALANVWDSWAKSLDHTAARAERDDV